MRRFAKSCSLVTVLLSIAPAALAQRDWLPCTMADGAPSGSGGTVVIPTGPLQAESEGITVHESYMSVSLEALVADYDRFDGAAIPEIKVRGTALGLAYRFEDRWIVQGRIPYYSVRDDGPGDDIDGFGDISLLASARVAKGGRFWLAAWFGGTLPTSDDGLGFDDPTARAGLSANWGEDVKPATGHLTWATPRWRFSFGAQYVHNFTNADLSTLDADAGVVGAVGGGPYFVYGVGLSGSWELGGDVDMGPGMTRDAWSRPEARCSFGFATPAQHVQLAVGARFALGDDGLHDDVIPTLTLVGRWD